MAQADLPRSPLAPDHFPVMDDIKGVRLQTAEAGFKYKNRPDLLLVTFDEGTTAGGVFTTSSAAAAPVHWSKQRLADEGLCRALVVTAGNANAFTGEEGKACVAQIASSTARVLEGASTKNVLIAQTGVIGQSFPTQKYEDKLPDLVKTPPASWEDAARAIMTTDTFPKGATRQVDIDGINVTLSGIAKGSGMVEPNMATMLAFVMTDARLEGALLQALVREANETSFNAITVDGDMSTNDCLMVFATGAAGHDSVSDISDPRVSAFREALRGVCEDLAQQIVKDGEGARKFVRVDVRGAESDASAKKIAKSIANSPLVKTAIAGGDANWGRLVMAVGKSGEPVHINKLTIHFGPHLVAQDGAVHPSYEEETGEAYFQETELNLAVNVGVGNGAAHVWTCDLTHGYIAINADYRS